MSVEPLEQIGHQFPAVRQVLDADQVSLQLAEKATECAQADLLQIVTYRQKITMFS